MDCEVRVYRYSKKKIDNMIQNWFECKIKYEKTLENGTNKAVTEAYIVDALSFTEAEARIIEEVTPFMNGEFTVQDIKRQKFSEIFTSTKSSDDRWFKLKLTFVTLDEKSGNEKKTNSLVLVQAGDIRAAIRNCDEGMKGGLADYVIASAVETAYMDVYQYKGK